MAHLQKDIIILFRSEEIRISMITAILLLKNISDDKQFYNETTKLPQLIKLGEECQI